MGSSMLEVIGHYQRSIEKSINDEPRLLHCMDKLYNLPIKVEHLQKTGIGKTVNSLRKYKSEVGIAAKSLVAKWKAVVVEEDYESVPDYEECQDDKTNNNNNNTSHHTKTVSSSSSQDEKYSKSSKSNSRNDNIKEHKSQTHERKDIRSHHNGNKTNSIDTKILKEHHKTDEKDHHKAHHSSRKEDDKHRHKSSRSHSKDMKRKTSTDRSDHRVKNDLTNGIDSKDRDNKRKRKSSRSRSPVKSKIPKVEVVHEIDSSMGTSFEDALGMIAKPGTLKNSSSKKSPKLNTIEIKTKSDLLLAPLLASKDQLEPLDPSIALELPTIITNYKPDPHAYDRFLSTKTQPRQMTDAEAFGAGISSKTMRTKVYSGVRNGAIYQVPTLFDLSVRVLQKNFDALEYTGGVPYEILKPVIERVTPHQLLNFEEFNPYIIEDTDILWKQHCSRYYRGKQRQEMESWREMFNRCKEEQDNRLSLLAENIKQSQKQATLPIRKTQLAYIDSAVKPPRNIIRKQEQYGTKNVPVTPLGVKRAIAETSQANNFIRPKKAPLMQKSLQLMKGRFRR